MQPPPGPPSPREPLQGGSPGLGPAGGVSRCGTALKVTAKGGVGGFETGVPPPLWANPGLEAGEKPLPLKSLDLPLYPPPSPPGRAATRCPVPLPPGSSLSPKQGGHGAGEGNSSGVPPRPGFCFAEPGRVG